MTSRREFALMMATSGAGQLLMPALFREFCVAEMQPSTTADGLRFSSRYMDAELSSVAPAFVGLNVDCLGKSKRGSNLFQASPSAESGYVAASVGAAGECQVEYRVAQQDPKTPPVWTVAFSDRAVRLTTQWKEGSGEPFLFRFDLSKCHSTVLGVLRKDGLLGVPAVLHCPGQGSIRITADATEDMGLEYASKRRSMLATLEFPAATPERRRIVYSLEVVGLYPDLKGLEGDSRFDAFRRNWLNVLQLNPSVGALSNNTASTSCAFCYYEYADIAALTPPLAEGLTALDVVRQTLDMILAGGHAYGLPALGNFPVESSDTLPSLIISAAACVREGRSDAWLSANYEGIRKWAEKLVATDWDGDGLFKYKVSGNSGIWPNGFPMVRPSNWWDTIGFGHEDAYGNALAYRALGDMEMLASRANRTADAARYKNAAAQLRNAYYKTFFDPATGVLGGWRSADGELHDYYFLWVNGIAIHYGLVSREEANSIMDKLMAKMKEVGYDKFNMGLPGNLITVALKDYVHKDENAVHGGGVRADNSDGFQNYENGGATGCFVFFTLAALYDLGRKEEADRILFAMLGEYDKGGFEGRGAGGRSNDWRRWDGTPMGYEGFLGDNYYTLLAVPLREHEIPWKSGYRPMSRLS